MKQIGLIFWKDVRYLRLEQGVYLLLLAAYAIAAPQTWPGKPPNPFLAMFVSLLGQLMPVLWMVLITRAVQADSLVGEEQFWITRPYRWSSLLLAKTMFVVVCVALPFVAMQWVLLLEGGLPPFAAKAGTKLLLRFAIQMLLSFFVLASVTKNLASMFTLLVAIVVTWAGLLTFVLSHTQERVSPPNALALFGALFAVLMLAILIYQYARRRTVYSRLAVAGVLAFSLLMLFGVGAAGFGAPIKSWIRAEYPLRDSLRLVLTDSMPYEERREDDVRIPRNQVEVKLPIYIQGLPADAKVRDAHLEIELDGAGIHYAPPWQDAMVSDHAIGFIMPMAMFERLANADVHLHLELAAEELRPLPVIQSVAADTFAGPKNGLCSLVHGTVYCRHAYQQFAPVRVEAKTCSGDTWAALKNVIGNAADPVMYDTLPIKGAVCAGDLLRFTEYGPAGMFRVALDVPAIKLGQYRAL
jgi:hypothetical protein